MIPLSILISRLPAAHVIGPTSLDVRRVVYDSRVVQPGDCFVAVPGQRDDGARYIGAALERGAVAIVTEREDVEESAGCCRIVVPDARRALALLAAAEWGKPSSRLGLVGVTGTDGKTTTSMLIAEIFEAAGITTGLSTTVELRVNGERNPNPLERTTPEAPETQQALAGMLEAGAQWAVLEVSSHALALERVTGCEFDIAVMTNVSPEHLDFHHSFSEYVRTKGELFEMLALESNKRFRRFGVVNTDDPSADYFKAICPVDVVSYGMEHDADVRARDVILASDRSSFVVETPIGSRRLVTSLIGQFNVYNWLAAIAAAIGNGLDLDAVEEACSRMKPVRGRSQRIDQGQPFDVFVDFAHTPRGLAAALDAVRSFTRGRIILVFGAAGERFAENRPRLGAIASARADITIATSDDSYHEDPQRIMDQIVGGMNRPGQGARSEVILDRRQAIRRAIQMARPGDTVLIAGRGHEEFQTYGDQKIPFDDAVVAREEIGRLRLRAA